MKYYLVLAILSTTLHLATAEELNHGKVYYREKIAYYEGRVDDLNRGIAKYRNALEKVGDEIEQARSDYDATADAGKRRTYARQIQVLAETCKRYEQTIADNQEAIEEAKGVIQKLSTKEQKARYDYTIDDAAEEYERNNSTSQMVTTPTFIPGLNSPAGDYPDDVARNAELRQQRAQEKAKEDRANGEEAARLNAENAKRRQQTRLPSDQGYVPGKPGYKLR